MSYTPTEWETADIVTAQRMNALETAVGDMNMSYTPNTWSDGDILSAAKMNALEQAVASGGGGGAVSDVFIIHYDKETYQLDKTWQEVTDALDAYNAGDIIITCDTYALSVASTDISGADYRVKVHTGVFPSGGTEDPMFYADSANGYPAWD